MHSCENKSILKKRENEIRASMEAAERGGLKAAPKPWELTWIKAKHGGVPVPGSAPKLCWLEAWSDPSEGKCYTWLVKGQKEGQDSWELQKSAPAMAAT